MLFWRFANNLCSCGAFREASKFVHTYLLLRGSNLSWMLRAGKHIFVFFHDFLLFFEVENVVFLRCVRRCHMFIMYLDSCLLSSCEAMVKRKKFTRGRPFCVIFFASGFKSWQCEIHSFSLKGRLRGRGIAHLQVYFPVKRRFWNFFLSIFLAGNHLK